MIAKAKVNFGDPMPEHENYPSMLEMTVSNKWSKLLHSLVTTTDVKHDIVTRCAIEHEQKFNNNLYVKMKFAKAVLKQYTQCTNDGGLIINVENLNLEDDDANLVTRYLWFDLKI